MRQGEIFGLTRNRLRLLGTNPVVVVDRQLLTRLNRVTEFGPLKTRASYRTIPLPATVVDALNEHLAARDIGDDDLIFTLDGRPITRQAFGHVWRPVAKVAGLNQATGPGMHALRHYYASLLIRYGESVKTVQARLGHASAVRDPRHLQPPVAGLRRPDTRGDRLCAWSARGDWQQNTWRMNFTGRVGWMHHQLQSSLRSVPRSGSSSQTGCGYVPDEFPVPGKIATPESWRAFQPDSEREVSVEGSRR